MHQRKRVMKIRTQLAEQWNRGIRGGIETSVSAKGPGKIITNMEEKNGKAKTKWGRSATMLPDMDLKIGLAMNGSVYTAKNVSESVVGDASSYKNVPVVLLPGANGEKLFSPLMADKLSDTREIPTMVYFLELFMRHTKGLSQTKTEVDHIERLKDETGFDITTPQGLRAIINQYFTYTQSFDEKAVAIDAQAEPGTDRHQSFLFNITDGGNIMIGTSFSGQKPRFAELSKTGELDKFFIEAFIDGMKQRPKNVVFSDGFAGIRGMNSFGEIKVPLYSKGKLILRKYDSYNDYVKDFTQTIVYGKHQPWGAGQGYTYVANPTMQLKYPGAEPNAPTIQARTPEIEPVADSGDAGEEYDSLEDDGLGELAGLFGAQSSIRTIPGIVASLENLQDLRTFTPEAEGTVAAAKKSLERIRANVIAPQHSPFTHC